MAKVAETATRARVNLKIIATIEISMSEIMGFTYSRYKFQKKVEKCRTLLYIDRYYISILGARCANSNRLAWEVTISNGDAFWGGIYFVNYM